MEYLNSFLPKYTVEEIKEMQKKKTGEEIEIVEVSTAECPFLIPADGPVNLGRIKEIAGNPIVIEVH